MATAKFDNFFASNAPVNPNYQDEVQNAAILQNSNFDPDYQNGLVGMPGFFKKLGGYDVEAERTAAITKLNQEYERQSIDSARAWSEYMDNTQYQRTVKDLEAAGLNPWLAIQNGISGSGIPSVDTGGTAQQSQSQSTGQSSGILRGLLLLIAGIVAKNPKAAASGAVAITNKSWYK